MTLPDTSAWIEYFRRTESTVDRRLDELIGSGANVAVTDPVVMEVLVGARSRREEQELRHLLRRFDLLPFVAATDFDGAVYVYQRCRERGVTPRGMVDCMIAAVAVRHQVAVLTADRDLARIGEVMDLRLDPASVAP